MRAIRAGIPPKYVTESVQSAGKSAGKSKNVRELRKNDGGSNSPILGGMVDNNGDQFSQRFKLDPITLLPHQVDAVNLVGSANLVGRLVGIDLRK